MSDRGDIRRDLEPGMDPGEAAALAEVGERLRGGRPVPAAAFRGDLRRSLMARAGEADDPRGPAPARLRLWIAANGAAGAGLLFVALLSVAGVGPLAA
jgi:hypothetical protein